MFEGSIAIVEDPNAVPEFGLLVGVSARPSEKSRGKSLPSDLVNNRELVDMPYTLAEDLRSSSNNALRFVSPVSSSSDATGHTQVAPDLAVVFVQLQDDLQIFDRPCEFLFRSEDGRDCFQRWE